jgi:DNA polymerase-3 subunit beta
MNFSCTQENLAHALALVARVASRNTNLPILQNVLIEASETGIRLAATNLEIGLQVRVRGKVAVPGSFTVPANLLSNYISLLPSERIDCELIGNELDLHTTDHSSRIKGEPAADFPILPTIEKNTCLTLDRAVFMEVLQQVVVAAAIDESRPEIAGVYIHTKDKKLVLAATDSYRLAERTVVLPQATEGAVGVILPQRSAVELLRLLQSTAMTEQVDICVSETQLGCVSAEVEFVSRLVQGHFPDYEQIIPQTGRTTITAQRADLVKAVKGAALFSKTGVNDIEVAIKPDQQQMTVRATNAQVGENTAIVAADIGGEATSVVLNYRFMLDGLQHGRGDNVTVLLNDRNSPGVLRSTDPNDSYVYIIMPIKQ